MTMKRMLIDASHSEETRVVVINGNKLEDFDVEVESRKQLKGNIYLARVTRVEPSLQAAFIEYGGNRQGFLAFSEIHPDYYRIPVEDKKKLIAEASAQTDEELKLIENIPNDEVILECPSEEISEAQSLTIDTMGEAFDLLVPLEVNISSGQSWADAK